MDFLLVCLQNTCAVSHLDLVLVCSEKWMREERGSDKIIVKCARVHACVRSETRLHTQLYFNQ